jgi:hypothetical protein
MLSTLRSTLHVEIHPPGNDVLPRVPDQSVPQVSDESRGAPVLNASEASPANSQHASSSQPILDFIASDESLDRCDEVICASGWRLDSYRRNPVFQNAHQYGDIMFTLGKALITEVRSTECGVRNAEGKKVMEVRTTPHSALPTPHLFQRIQFATDVNPIARIAYGLYKGKFLNAVSVGFIPIRWQDADGKEHVSRSTDHASCNTADASRSTLLAPRSSVPGRQAFRRRYLEQELLEVSAVGIPANPNALALGLKAGAIEKSDLREILDLLKSVCGAVQKNPEDRVSPPGEPDPAIRKLQLLFLARELRRLLRRA